MVSVEDFHAGTPGSTPPRHFGYFLNRAAVGWAVSCSAFGLFFLFFLNRAAVGWAVSCSAFGLLPRSRRRARSCFAFGLLFFFLVLSVTISKPPHMMFRG